MKTFPITLLARTPDWDYEPEFGNSSQEKINTSTHAEFHKNMTVMMDQY